MTRVFAIVVVLMLVGSVAYAQEPASEKQVHQTVDRAITYLQTESGTWMKQRRCAACHHAPMPLWALAEAERNGFSIDKKFLNDTAANILGSREKMIASRIIPDPAGPPDPRPMERGVSTGAVFNAAAARSFLNLDAGERESIKFIADDIVKKQQPDGSWEFFLSRPPINEDQFTDTAWIIMALQTDAVANPGIGSHEAALKKGLSWLTNAKLPHGLVLDKALVLLVQIRDGVAKEKLQPLVDDIIKRQRADGGWAQQETSANSDGFATGEALYVLSLAGRAVEQPEIRRGIAYLVTTQKEDGTWPMTSRGATDGSTKAAKNLAPITCGATSWATLALVQCVPAAKPH